MKRLTPVQVEWEDSAFTGGWRRSYQRVTTSQCKTIGYLIEKTKRQVVVSMDVNEDGGYAETMAIPRAVVKSIKKVKVC